MYTLNPMESNHRDGPISLSCYSTAILSLTCYGHGQYNSKNNNSFSTYSTLFQCFVFMWELHAPIPFIFPLMCSCLYTKTKISYCLNVVYD